MGFYGRDGPYGLYGPRREGPAPPQVEVLRFKAPKEKARARHLVGPGGIFTYGKVHSVHFVHTVHPVQFVHRFNFSLSSPNP